MNRNLVIDPFSEVNLQPNSYDIHLHPDILWMNGVDPNRPLDPREDCSWAYTKATLGQDGRDDLLMPDACILARSVERFVFPNDLAGRLEGVSTNGRLFLKIHVTAGFFDAGFPGTATLEMKNIGPRPIVLYPGMRIGQMSFEELSTPCLLPYGQRNRYAGQVDPTPSRGYSPPAHIGESWYEALGAVYSRYVSSGDEPARTE